MGVYQFGTPDRKGEFTMATITIRSYRFVSYQTLEYGDYFVIGDNRKPRTHLVKSQSSKRRLCRVLNTLAGWGLFTPTLTNNGWYGTVRLPIDIKLVF